MLETISGTNPASAFVLMFHDPTNRWFTFYLACSFGIACLVYLRETRRDPELKRQGLLGFLFPKEVYGHRSAIADYWFFVVNKLLFALAFAALIAVTAYVGRAANVVFHAVAVSPQLPAPTWLAILLATIVAALAMDFGLWLGHWLLHKVPVLWEFHKVHHSAEVLTPLTAGRVHPLEDAINILFSGSCGGIALALCQFLLGPKAQTFSPFQLNALIVIFFIFGFHLRHTHIWLPYKGIWGKLFISPAHHQLHHSIARRHWDKNLGFGFAIWDWMFGTLYPVDEREPIEIGMNGREEPEYHSLRALYFLPFVKAWRVLTRSRETRALGAAHLPPAE
jgi:sterol desaturase/sphingolipid hydroxylase (fatty acid hydroxylase superfamily)